MEHLRAINNKSACLGVLQNHNCLFKSKIPSVEITEDKSESKTTSHLSCCIYSVSVTPHFRLGIR